MIRVPVDKARQLEDGQMAPFPCGEFQVLICRVHGKLYAVENLCSHAKTPLDGGKLEEYRVTCPLHGAKFDVRDGCHQSPPAFTGIISFEVEDSGDAISVLVPEKKPVVDPLGGLIRTR
ncbi:MAG: Rieske 2Fe-2S domain-containing protein [Gammaproteobacteria bacterium]|nr:Rieske 2Fe-2S domain-containing protein [Gammaproteobacteria bacterium]